MNVIDVADLKDQLDKTTEWLAAGEVVRITRDGMPFAYATPNSLISSSEQINTSASDVSADALLADIRLSRDFASPVTE